MGLPSGVTITGSGPALIMLHSSLSSSKQWLALVSELKSIFTIINIDILGYGEAAKVDDPAGYNFNIELERIQQILNESIGSQNFHLLGHSCGGAIALKLAYQQPKKILSMALYEPVAFHLLPKGTAERAEADAFADKVAELTNEQAAEVFTDFWNAKGFYKSLPDKMQRSMALDMEKVNLDFIGLISEKYQLADLAAIQCPVLLLSGKFSPYLSQYLVHQLAKYIPNAQEKQVLAGHMGPISHASLINQRLVSFFNPKS